MPCKDKVKKAAYQREYYKRHVDVAKERHRKSNYGITQKEFELLLQVQNYRCPICTISLNQSSHLDHDHKTGRIRGVLCSKCNVGLGNLCDDISLLKQAQQYLEKHSLR